MGIGPEGDLASAASVKATRAALVLGSFEHGFQQVVRKHHLEFELPEIPRTPDDQNLWSSAIVLKSNILKRPLYLAVSMDRSAELVRISKNNSDGADEGFDAKWVAVCWVLLT